MTSRGRQRLHRLSATFRTPADVVLALRIGYFLLTVRRRLEQSSLPTFLNELADQNWRLLGAADPVAAAAHLDRLTTLWLRLPSLRGYHTCYVRALVHFRFLDSGSRPMRIHLAIASASDRLHGHAWVTVDDIILDPEMRALSTSTRPLYSFPETVQNVGLQP